MADAVPAPRVAPLFPQQDLALAAELLDLQRRSYRVEADLIGDSRIPPLHESVADLQGRHLTWLGVRTAVGALAGAVGVVEGAASVEIDRLVVDPALARRGLGRLLVSTVVDRADGRPIAVSTGRDNVPARRLYEAAGFTAIRDREVLPGLWITEYVRA